MRRTRAKHRYLSAIAVCAIFATLSNVRSSLFLRSLSSKDSIYNAMRGSDASSTDEHDFEFMDAPKFYSINIRGENYESIDLPTDDVKNATVWVAPRVVVLSDAKVPSHFTKTHHTNSLSSILGSSELETLLPIPANDSKIELPKGGQKTPSGKVYRKFEREWYEDCDPVTKASEYKERNSQSAFQVRSTCNIFHEMNLVEAYGSQSTRDHIELLGEGSWRSVWKLVIDHSRSQAAIMGNKTSQQTPEPELVLKLLLNHQKYDENSFSIHQVDAFVMEALSSSDYIVDSFGFCGQSVITEAATSSGRSLMKKKSLSSVDRLRIARDLARGLADLHALFANHWNDHETESTRPLVFAHHDVNPANLISVGDDQIQWNDFNLGLLNRQYAAKKNDKTTECPVPVRYEQLLWRSPEECQNHSGTLFLDTSGTGRNTAAQAADVYSLGNILFYVLARHQPWSHLEEEQPGGNSTRLSTGSSSQNKRDSLLAISSAKIQGKLPNLPERYRKRPAAKLLWEAVQMCYTHDPKLRPTAMEVAEFLGNAYEQMNR